MKYILSIEDGWSRYVNLVPIPDKSAASVATALMDEFLSRFGMPAEIFSDQGKEFCNQVFEELKTLGKFEHQFSPAYSPAGNLVERFHRNLTKLLTIDLVGLNIFVKTVNYCNCWFYLVTLGGFEPPT